MKIDVCGLSKKINNDKLILGCQWLCRKLITEHLHSRLSFDIMLIPYLRRKCKLYGFCRPLGISFHEQFEIHLDACSSQRNILLALCHEMVHVKQFATGQLSVNGEQAYWAEKYITYDEIDYWDRPWEIEAHGREQGLFHYLVDYFDQLKI